jgi:hypothetical protein
MLEVTFATHLLEAVVKAVINALPVTLVVRLSVLRLSVAAVVVTGCVTHAAQRRWTTHHFPAQAWARWLDAWWRLWWAWNDISRHIGVC